MGDPNNKICVVVPYFGSRPAYFELWLKSASRNPTIDFHLVGDCFKVGEPPRNVFIHAVDFQELNSAIVEKLGGRPLTSPYKLCDLKPAYGVLFSDIVDGYEIWGFSDLDLLYGSILGVVEIDSLPKNWGRLFDFGHLSFFPNEPEVNRAFEIPCGALDVWPFVRDSRIIWVFDEHYRQGLGGVNERLEHAGRSVVGMREHFSDVMPWYLGFFDREKGVSSNLFFMWCEGRIWRYSLVNDAVCREETSYVHLQKRKFRIQQCADDLYFLTPEHWGDVKSPEQGISMLKANFDDDIQPHLPRKLPPFHKARKWMYFVFEAMFLKHGYAALATLALTVARRWKRS